jgi:hypothetical protein
MKLRNRRAQHVRSPEFASELPCGIDDFRGFCWFRLLRVFQDPGGTER